MRPASLRFTLILSVMTLSRAAHSQQTPSNPPPDVRFKADILVIAPHPDDESTIAGYLARAVLDEHRRVAEVLQTPRPPDPKTDEYHNGHTATADLRGT